MVREGEEGGQVARSEHRREQATRQTSRERERNKSDDRDRDSERERGGGR